jgi:hypothetical protein
MTPDLSSALRRHAVPIVDPTAGGPLIKRTVDLGWMKERRKVRVPMDDDFPQDRRKEFLRKMAQQFIDEETRIDGARYSGGMEIQGPFPHFDPHEADTQVGDRGATRPVSRSIKDDTSENGKEDYVLEALFIVPEYVNEIPTSLAMDLFTKPGGRPGLRPLREKDWR